MGWVLPAIMAGSALMGAMGGKGKHKSQSTTQTSQRTPWNQGWADNAWGQYNDASNRAGGIDWGPTRDQNRMYRSMMGQYGPGAGGGGGGGMAGNMQGGGRRRGGGGGGGMKWDQKYGGQNVDYSDYEQRVMAPEYMDVASDPYIQAQQAYRRGLFDENAAGSRTAAMAPFLQAGGTMGLTGAAMGMQSKMQQANERDWTGQEGAMFMDERNARRQQAMGANQAWSGREGAFDQAAIGGDTNIKTANISAAADRYNTDSNERVGMAGIGAQNAQNRFAQQQAMFGMAGQMAAMQREGQGLGAMNLWGQNLNQQLPWQGNFGKNTQTTTVPGVGSKWGNIAQGLGGGAIQGAGMWKNMGSPKTWASVIS